MSSYKSKHTGSEIDATIDRAKAGGEIDTLLAGKAPAGYGLGGGSKQLTADDDLNNIWKCGWYFWGATPSNSPSDPSVGDYGSYKYMLAINSGSDYALSQIVFNWYGSIILRQKIANTIGEWEWLNPAMSLGVEYRTTERYLGKPVYVKLVNLGALPNTSTKSVTWGDSTTKAFELSACAISGEQYSTLPIDNQAIAWVGAANVSIKTTSNYSSWTAYALIKYTKTTD